MMENIGAFQFQTKDNYLKSTMLNDHFKGSSLPSQFILVSPSLGARFSEQIYSLPERRDSELEMEFLELKHPLTHSSKR